MIAILLLISLEVRAAEVRVESSVPAAPLSERQKNIHVLNRLSFGPRPGEVERLSRKGIESFISEQLHPELIVDSSCEEKLKGLANLKRSMFVLSRHYPRKPEVVEDPIIVELAAAKILRAALSERQLQEVMVDFWFNHFNVDGAKYGMDVQLSWLLPSYENDVIRPRAFGKFRDLLGAVAHSPAMLFNLDNYLSTAEVRYLPYTPGKAPGLKNPDTKMEDIKRLGINENFARELMELHTLGVDGGYTQKDVAQLALILTGWTIRIKAHNDKAFTYRFEPKMHDYGDKALLGQVIASSGEQEGEKALDLLARHPATARFIARKLCRRFIADDPPESLVLQAAERFIKTDGDIRETLRAIFESPDFYDSRYFRAKIKSPFEFVVSGLRVAGAEPRDPIKIVRLLERDEPLYRRAQPDGYPDSAQFWINSNLLMARSEKSNYLFSEKQGIAVENLLKNLDERDGTGMVNALVSVLLQDEISLRSRAAIFQQLHKPQFSTPIPGGRKRRYHPANIAALIFALEDFQGR